MGETVINEKGHPYRWPLHALLTITYLMCFCVRFSWSTLKPYFGEEIAFTNAEIGSYMSAFYIGYVLTQGFAGYLADRFGVKYVLFISLMLQAVSIWFLPSVLDEYYLGFLLRIISGLGAGVIYAACIKSVVNLFPDKEKNIAFGILMGAPFLGVLVPNFFLPKITDAFSWQWSFKFVAIFTFIVAIFVLFFVINKYQKSGAKNKTFLEGVKFFFTKKTVVFFTLSNFFLLWVMIGFISWGNTYFTDIKYAPEVVARTMQIYGFFGILGAFVFGFFAAKTSYKKHMFMVVACFIVMAICFLLFSYTINYWLILLFVILLGITIGAICSLSLILIATFSGKEWAGVTGGISALFFQFAAMLSPYVLGKLVDWQNGSYASVWWVLAGACIFGIVFMLLALPYCKKEEIKN